MAGLSAAKPIQLIRLDYSVNNVSNASWTQLSSSLTGDSQEMEIFDSGGHSMVLGYGPAGSEVNYIYVPPGGMSNRVGAMLNKGMRLAVKGVDGNASTGQLILNLYAK